MDANQNKTIENLIYPTSIEVIQGGMGVGISLWELAKPISKIDKAMGVVSGTALDTVLVRELQLGDK